MSKSEISQVKTNVITGFLGVGKTTAIQHLLKNKPQNERWAVLVNEFGEIGIDASLFGVPKPESQVFIKEIPGGCMCCASGLPMQVALNQLLKQARPDRLIIEPTGLGHPHEVLALLCSDAYESVLDVRATLTLVDARVISDQRYTQHHTFIQQLEIADVVVASKSDLYQEQDIPALADFLNTNNLTPQKLYKIEQGQVELTWLDNDIKSKQFHSHSHHHSVLPDTVDIAATVKAQGHVRVDNEGEGYYSSGWIFAPQHLFDFQKIFNLLTVLPCRVKGVFITPEGIFSFNKNQDVLSCVELDETYDSRIEVIGEDKSQWAHLETELFNIKDELSSLVI